MRVCPKCNFQNDDAALICAACTATLASAGSAMGDVDAFMADKARQKRQRTILTISAIGILVVGGVIYGIVMYKNRQTRMVHRAFYESFVEADEKSYGEFWSCFYRKDKAAFALKNNLELSDLIVKAYEANPRGFRTHVEEKCLPKIKEVSRRVGALGAPPDYAEALERYVKSSTKVDEAAVKIAGDLGKLYEDSKLEKQVVKAGDKWHEAMYRKEFPKEVTAYDHFLRCAIPGFDQLKNADEVAQELLKYYKNRDDYVARLHRECFKFFADPPSKPTKNYEAGLNKFEGEHEEPRDTRAFKDIFNRVKKHRQEVVLHPIAEVWAEYKNSRAKVYDIAAENLK